MKVITPTELKEEKAKKFKEKKLKEKERKEKIGRIKKDFSECFATPVGLRALEHIIKMSCFNESSVGMTKDGIMDFNATIHNEGRRGLYLDMRKMIDKDILKKAELNCY